ncbi:MAG: flagellar hook-associated protein FlgK [Defluviitaleaceae bacterium]|nr:flagellar hook-associated protein FlgK [Defluviitaleaceae bacterium]MCL2836055.1 flagellar hook-associated protein FlgK [Defluviitaleaceae bacterium]
MKSSFFEFHVAVSGLNSAQAALQTVAHNVANAETKGFSRQVALSKATAPLQLMNGRGMVGTGSHVFSVIQIRDVFLDKKYWGAMPTLGEYNIKRTQLSINQAVLAEMNGTGLSSVFNKFFDTLQDLTTHSGDATYRTNVLSSAESLTTFLKDTYETFVKQQRDVNAEIAAVVQTINSIGGQIRTLNDRIRVIEASGNLANDLRDQRALLVDELSRYVNIEAYEIDYGKPGQYDKRFFVKINGQDFVMNNNLRQLTVRPREAEMMDYDAPVLDRFGFEMFRVNGREYSRYDNGTARTLDLGTSGLDPLGNYGLYISGGTGLIVDEDTGEIVGRINVPNPLPNPPPASIDLSDINDDGYPIAADIEQIYATERVEVYRNGEDNPGMYDIFWGNGNTRFDIYSRTLSGELKGLIDVRDGNNGSHAAVSGGYAKDMYSPKPPTLTVPISSLSKIDLAESGGIIRVTDPRNGQAMELIYNSYEINTISGEVVFELVYKNQTEEARINDFFTTMEAHPGGRITIGATTDYKGIPYYLSRLNDLARTFVSAINFGTRLDGTVIPDVVGHVNGYNLNGEKGAPDDPDKPTLFFTYWDDVLMDYVTIDQFDNTRDDDGNLINHNIFKIKANNIFVNPLLIRTPSLLNGASSPRGENEADHGVDNNNTFISWGRINTDNTVFSEGRLLDYIIGMTGELAIDIKQAENFERNYNSLTVQLNIQRISVSGVDINEEMITMIRLNQQWQAAARLINVIDGIYSNLVNNLGVT